MKRALLFSAVLMGFAMQAYAAETTAHKTNKPAEATSVVAQATALTGDAKADGEKFMSTNKTEPGVVSLSSGLQYKIVEAGKGKKPAKSDTVTVDYEGTLLNGTVFDSSYKRGQPISFPLSNVIAGWQEGLQLMPEGSTWMLYIPPHLAYGKMGAPPMIGPDETLVFKVHLISIK